MEKEIQGEGNQLTQVDLTTLCASSTISIIIIIIIIKWPLNQFVCVCVRVPS